MKKILLPAILILAASAAVYFIFFNGPGEAGNSTSPGTETAADSSARDTAPPPPSPAELRREQRLKEHARPQDFVALNYDSRRNLLGEAIIEGTLTNNSELTQYREFQMMIYFEDELGNARDSASQVVFDAVEPGASLEFRLKEKQPKRTLVRLGIREAVAEDIPSKGEERLIRR